MESVVKNWGGVAVWWSHSPHWKPATGSTWNWGSPNCRCQCGPRKARCHQSLGALKALDGRLSRWQHWVSEGWLGRGSAIRGLTATLTTEALNSLSCLECPLVWDSSEICVSTESLCQGKKRPSNSVFMQRTLGLQSHLDGVRCHLPKMIQRRRLQRGCC